MVPTTASSSSLEEGQMPALIISVDCGDLSDLDWIRTRAVAAVEEIVQEQIDEARISDQTEVSWEVED